MKKTKRYFESWNNNLGLWKDNNQTKYTLLNTITGFEPTTPPLFSLEFEKKWSRIANENKLKQTEQKRKKKKQKIKPLFIWLLKKKNAMNGLSYQDLPKKNRIHIWK